jgi:hypothetical protein
VRSGFRRLELGSAHGFTLTEVLVAALVLVTGLLALFGTLDLSVRTSFTTRAREGAVTLAQQVAEDANTIPFEQLSNPSITSTLQAMPGLATTSGSTWQVLRRGVTYTITASECAVDDPKDGYGVHDPTIVWCSDSAQTGTTDQQPVDFKRVTVNVSWFAAHSTHSISDTTTRSAAGQTVALATSSLQLATPAVGTSGVSGTATSPTITLASILQLTFTVTAPSGTCGIVWSVNGATQSWTSTSNSSSSCSGTTWTSSTPWTLTGLSDGSYQIGAQAQDAQGVLGPTVSIQVVLSRGIPAAPKLLHYGFNPNLGGGGALAAELQWQANSELNVTGYQITNPSSIVICTTQTTAHYPASCGTNVWCSSATACIDLSPPATNASNLTYLVAAQYQSATGTAYGPASSATLAGASSAQNVPAPPAPSSLTVSPQADGSAVLTWTQPSPATTTVPISIYRIYRDGHSYTNRYDYIDPSSCTDSTCTYTDSNRTGSHSYYVTSVGNTTPGSDEAESAVTAGASG